MFLKVESKSQWRDLSDKALFKTFFHSSGWEDFLEKEFRWIGFEHYAWRNEALLSVARCRMFGREKLVSHPFCEYGGPLPLQGEVDFDGFQKDFVDTFGSKARIKFHPYILKFGNTSPPLPAGRQARPLLTLRGGERTTFWVENFSKKSTEDLWKNFRKTLKQEIKGGEGVLEIKECASESELRQFYKIYLATVKRHKNIPLPFSVFVMFNGMFTEHAKILLAKHNDKVVGGSIFLFYPPFIHYYISASDERFRGANIGHQILWHVMQKYVGGPTSHIYDYFDLGGTRKGSTLEVFKRGWGAKEHPLFGIGSNSDKGGVSSLRNILGLVPPALMERAASFALWLKV